VSKSTDYRVPFDWHGIDLADGRTAGPGDVVSLSDEDLKDPHNQALVDEGHLLKVEEAKSKKTEEGS
jgi:hypothetical protein